MAIDTAYYVVTRKIAERTGELQNHYRTNDGRFVLDDRALSLIKFTTDEYINGLDGVEKITRQEALTLIAKGGYHLGDSDMEVILSEEDINVNNEEE